MRIKNIYQLLSLYSIAFIATHSYCAQMPNPEVFTKNIVALKNRRRPTDEEDNFTPYEKLRMLREINFFDGREINKLEAEFEIFFRRNPKTEPRIEEKKYPIISPKTFQKLSSLKDIDPKTLKIDIDDTSLSYINDNTFYLYVKLDKINNIEILKPYIVEVSHEDKLNLTPTNQLIYQQKVNWLHWDRRSPQKYHTLESLESNEKVIDLTIAFRKWMYDPTNIRNLIFNRIAIQKMLLQHKGKELHVYKEFQKALYPALGIEFPYNPMEGRPYLKTEQSSKSKALSFATQFQPEKALFHGSQASLAFRPNQVKGAIFYLTNPAI